ncbi:phosphoglycolate phosphatase [Chromohalobacter marismortui]|uniref:Phosphoglycolate phosphatase n=1 Tax=Chromohalobacter marismortui TaxID=42055 RepID=A0A4R7NQM3_9GAMM|nr:MULTISPECIES: HAD-IA family hydrolase [Chromohalobacter]MCI0508955.1 HAD-IA family hydrolase [Chromohalobacter sp.]MCI0592315.1 HAD-IA family hydrolase [Chromohalobacter sp.]TDU22670.1 phosphoglycolate phosphatase [Chromohalobacter marismortui]
MSHARPAALLFDLDGTLVDTAPDLAHATNALRAHHGLAPLAYDSIRAQVSNGGSALVELALGWPPTHAEHGEARRFLLEVYGRDVARHSRVFPGLEPLLNAWDHAHRPWGIVTNKPRLYAEPLVEALNLTHGVLLAADDLPLKKPDPAPLLEAARRLGVAPANCWYIGDHLRDMQAARAAGMSAIAVRYGYIGVDETPDSWPVDHWFETPESLTQALWPGTDDALLQSS